MQILILSFILLGSIIISAYGQSSQKAEPSLKSDKEGLETQEPTNEVDNRLFVTNGEGDTVFVNKQNGNECELSFTFLNGIKKVVFDCEKNKIFLYNPVKQMIKREGFTGIFYEIFDGSNRIGYQRTDNVEGVNVGFFFPDDGSAWQLLSKRICEGN